jgi:hypothetical protein
MGLEAEGEDGGADKEDRDNTDTLEILIIRLPEKNIPFTLADDEE